MKRSSIFSREYEKKIRRRRFTILFIVLLLSIMMVYYIINFSEFNSHVKNIYYSIIMKDDKSVSVEKEDENILGVSNEDEQNDSNQGDLISEDNEVNVEHLVHELQLSEDSKVHILYQNNDGIKYLDSQAELPENYKFDISPSRNKILIEEINTQDVYLIDENLNSFKLDPEFFYSNSANTSFYKTDIVNRYSGYLWYKNPKFLDDNTIVYVSNLPWFGREDQYIWRTDISDTENIKHFMTSTGGQNIDFGELTEEGIKVNINNEIKLLTFSFILN